MLSNARTSVIRLLACFTLFSFLLSAQPPSSFPVATVGVPFTLNFGEGLQNIPPIPEISFTFTFSLAGGTPPPGLSLSSNGLLSGTPTAPGTYSFSVRLALTVSAQGQSFSFDDAFPFSLTVEGSTGPQLSVAPGGLSFTFLAGAPASSQYLSIGNKGNLPRGFVVSASVNSGGSWLSVSPTGGTAAPFAQGSVLVTSNPGSLPPGTYVGTVTVSFAPGPEQFSVPVVMTVSSSQQNIGLSQSGLTFRAVAGGGTPPSQSFSVFNVGAGALNWTAATSTLAGGPGWLSVSPASGRSDATTASVIQVQAKPAGLAAGDYYGQIQISADGVVNSPQSVPVVLTVLPATADPGPTVLPTGLIFVGPAGGANPAVQTVEITNLTSRPLNFATGVSFTQGNKWFTPQPSSGTVAPGQPARVQIQTALAGLTTGIYRGELNIRFLENSITSRVDILLVVIPPPSAAPKSGPGAPRSAGCAPTQLLPIFTQLGSSFTTTAAWPTPLELRVIDDCGVPMTTGAVVATFSSGDPLVALTSLRDGRWTGTWQPRSVPTAPVTITATAQIATPPLKGTASIGGSLQPNPTVPVISAGGVVSAASLAPLVPLAPGSLVRISGSNLAAGAALASELPLPTELNDAQALLGGRPLPLQSAGDGQINAIVPFDVPINTTHQLIVRRAASYSGAEPVIIAAAQPAIFTVDGSGKGAAVVTGVTPDGTQFLVDADNPVSEGYTVIINCAGLGPVDPPIDAGVAAPESPLSQTVNPVTVTIGGQPAEVVSAALAPNYAGIYQVTAVVPSGVTPAPDVPVVVTVADQVSSPATINVQ